MLIESTIYVNRVNNLSSQQQLHGQIGRSPCIDSINMLDSINIGGDEARTTQIYSSITFLF
jgi:hypothetical protein